MDELVHQDFTELDSLPGAVTDFLAYLGKL